MHRGKPQQKTSSLVGLEDKWRRDPFENLLRWQQKGTQALVQSKEMVQSCWASPSGGEGLAQLRVTIRGPRSRSLLPAKSPRRPDGSGGEARACYYCWGPVVLGPLPAELGLRQPGSHRAQLPGRTVLNQSNQIKSSGQLLNSGLSRSRFFFFQLLPGRTPNLPELQGLVL